jgi:hypothetical protein
MKRDLSTVMVPFPAGLMSSVRSSTAMGPGFAREIVNMLATASGAGSKRGGCVPEGPTLAGEEIVQLFSFVGPLGVNQVLAQTANGKIYVLVAGIWSLLRSGLNSLGVMRGTIFAGKLVLCNGFDPVMAWDGASLDDIKEWVVDIGGSLTFINISQFSIASDAAFYPVGKKIRVRCGGVLSEASVAAMSASGGIVTVTLTTAVLSASLDQVAFEAKPPAFAYIYAAHDRLWGFGRGPLQAERLSSNVDRLRVFYTQGVNDVSAWHNSAGIVPSMSLADKAGGLDEVLAMGVKDGLTVFFMRNQMQIWSGTNPTVSGDFAWQKTIPVGVVHGSLVVELPNDIAFMTRLGLRTLARVVQTEQLDVSDVGSEIDPTLSTALSEVLASDVAYRALRVCACAAQGWFGVKIAERLYVYQLAHSGRGWVVFEGLPAQATGYATTAAGGLVLAKNTQVYRYEQHVFDDAGAPIKTRWLTPWLSVAKNNRWANSYVEVVVERGAAMLLTLSRLRDLDNGNAVESVVEARIEPDYWDDALFDASYFDVARPSLSVVRDHFVCGQVAFAIESSSISGPLTLLGLKLYGSAEK